MAMDRTELRDPGHGARLARDAEPLYTGRSSGSAAGPDDSLCRSCAAARGVRTRRAADAGPRRRGRSIDRVRTGAGLPRGRTRSPGAGDCRWIDHVRLMLARTRAPTG